MNINICGNPTKIINQGIYFKEGKERVLNHWMDGVTKDIVEGSERPINRGFGGMFQTKGEIYDKSFGDII